MTNHGLGDWIHRREVKSAGRMAITAGTLELTYEQFSERINRLANAMSERGVQRGDRVAFLGENSVEFLETLFALGSIGAVFVPLNTRLAGPEVAFHLDDAGAKILVASHTMEPLVAAGVAETDVERVIVVDDGSRVPAEDGRLTLPVEQYGDVLEGASATRPQVNVGIDDLAIILYTSGTTGNPKGAMLSHANMTWNALNVISDMDISNHEVALMISPMFHVAALGMGVLPTFLKGGHLILEPRFEPGRALQLIEQHKATYISGVPTTYQMLAEHPDWETTDISSLHNLTCGGSAVPLRILETYEDRGLSFTMGYGMTETAPGATTLPARYSREKMGSAGLPQMHTHIRVADFDGNELPPNEVGEVQIQGPNVISGYWERPEANESSFITDDGGTWFRSGDMGYMDDDGFLFISDRLKDMIISGGENIYPAQIEQELAQMESIASVAVFGVANEKWGEVPRAAVVVREGHELTEEDVLSYLDGKLARYKIPKSVVFVDDMPRTASGKVRKPQLRELHGE
ncbi:long-chain fatty acid--CoA ligase [Yaniella flava]|uniref:Long-chain fatty acid--CoA ligase n=1 Tax=Yaniella flava TaxID=287930 RepID=A0ABP5FLM3_9MICC